MNRLGVVAILAEKVFLLRWRFGNHYTVNNAEREPGIPTLEIY